MKRLRAKVDDLVTAGAMPVVTRNGSVLLRDGPKSVTLQRPGGKVTAAGEYFQKQEGVIPGADTRYDPRQFPKEKATPSTSR